MFKKFIARKFGNTLIGDAATALQASMGDGLGVQGVADRKLMSEGLEGQGVITDRRVIAGKGRNAVLGAYVDVEGHINFDDGTEATFSSNGLDTSKIGDLSVGTIVPVRYDASHTSAVLDTAKLGAAKQAEKDTAAEVRESRDAEKIAAADAALAHQDESGHPERPS